MMSKNRDCVCWLLSSLQIKKKIKNFLFHFFLQRKSIMFSCVNMQLLGCPNHRILQRCIECFFFDTNNILNKVLFISLVFLKSAAVTVLIPYVV